MSKFVIKYKECPHYKERERQVDMNCTLYCLCLCEFGLPCDEYQKIRNKEVK